MDVYTGNVTNGLVQAMLAMTADERYATSNESICHYVHCTLSVNDHDESYPKCSVTPKSFISSNETLDLTIITKYIHLYIYPLVIFMGIFGNSLSCYIMFINVRRNGYPASLYLTLLAFIDCLYLLGSALPEWISKIDSRLDIKNLSNVSCRLGYWFGNFTTHLSAGLVVGVTVERFIAVQYPLIAHKLNTIKHTRIALIILIIFFFLLNSPVFILVKHLHEYVYIISVCYNDSNVTHGGHHISRCVPANNQYGQAWVWVDFATYAVIPFLIIMTLNSLIIRRLIDAQRFRQRMFRFHNTMRYDQQEMKYRHYSESHQAIEMLGTHSRYSRRFRSVPETKPLAMMLRPRLSQLDERRRNYSTKQSSLSTELSTLSSEIKIRSHHQYEKSSLRHKLKNPSNSNNTRLTILLLFISCSFLVLTLPAVVLNLIMSKKSSTSNSHNHFNSIITDNNNHSNTTLSYTLTRLLMIINHSINFILYFVLGKRFRRDLKQIFIGYWRKLYR